MHGDNFLPFYEVMNAGFKMATLMQNYAMKEINPIVKSIYRFNPWAVDSGAIRLCVYYSLNRIIIVMPQYIELETVGNKNLLW